MSKKVFAYHKYLQCVFLGARDTAHTGDPRRCTGVCAFWTLRKNGATKLSSLRTWPLVRQLARGDATGSGHFVWRAASAARRITQPSRWSSTSPIACMNA